MRAITIEAKSLVTAVGIRDALWEFDPALRGSDSEGYRVSVDASGSDRRVIDILGVLERHITGRNDGGDARVKLDGHHYTMNAEPSD